ncbi:unnamed protein product [Parascedosporium putredinis]|uniref:Uncharacterized protein n=1 Tax=Parascedosporium putredinis TaxID=1442378 RepID=A0A9P1MA13_9PEZI|nr:unnamed protein product [Parascedosporium putredinis]CAI7993097.1 unnamed protein product [Parascedosporium putredinis]
MSGNPASLKGIKTSIHLITRCPAAPPTLPQSHRTPALRVVLRKSWTKLTAELVAPGAATPTYVATLPKAGGILILHDGPNETDPPLAHARGVDEARHDHCEPRRCTAGRGRGGKITMHHNVGMKETFSFAMEVGHGAHRRVEWFEWRRSHGDDVRSVGQASSGWKLIRLGAGEEVVAVWADNKNWMSMSKVGELQFRGNGATGRWGSGGA